MFTSVLLFITKVIGYSVISSYLSKEYNKEEQAWVYLSNPNLIRPVAFSARLILLQRLQAGTIFRFRCTTWLEGRHCVARQMGKNPPWSCCMAQARQSSTVSPWSRA